MQALFDLAGQSAEAVALGLSSEQLQTLLAPLLAGAKSAAAQLQTSEIAAARDEMYTQASQFQAKLLRSRTANLVSARNDTMALEAKMRKELEDRLGSQEDAIKLAEALEKQGELSNELERTHYKLKTQDDTLKRTLKLCRESEGRAADAEKALQAAHQEVETQVRQLTIAQAELERSNMHQKELAAAFQRHRERSELRDAELADEASRLVALEAELAAERERRERLAKALSDNEHSHEETVRRMNGLENLIEAALRGEVSVDVCKASLDELRAEVHKLEMARSLSSDQVERFRLRLDDAHASNSKLERRTTELTIAKAELEARVAEMGAKLAVGASAQEREEALLAQLDAANGRTRSIEEEKFGLARELSDCCDKLERAQREVEKARAEEERNRAACSRAVEAMESMKSKLLAATDALGRGEEDSVRVLKVREEAKKERQQLVKSALESLSQLRVYLTAKLTGLRAELAPVVPVGQGTQPSGVNATTPDLRPSPPSAGGGGGGGGVGGGAEGLLARGFSPRVEDESSRRWKTEGGFSLLSVPEVLGAIDSNTSERPAPLLVYLSPPPRTPRTFPLSPRASTGHSPRSCGTQPLSALSPSPRRQAPSNAGVRIANPPLDPPANPPAKTPPAKPPQGWRGTTPGVASLPYASPDLRPSTVPAGGDRQQQFDGNFTPAELAKGLPRLPPPSPPLATPLPSRPRLRTTSLDGGTALSHQQAGPPPVQVPDPGQLSAPRSIDSRRREAELKHQLRAAGGDGVYL